MNRSFSCAVIAAALILFVPPAVGAAVPEGPVKVFILAGQSNMVGHGKIEMGRNPAAPESKDRKKRHIKGGLGSLRNLVDKNPDRYGPDGKSPLVNEQGEWLVRDDVWIWSTTEKSRPDRLDVHYGAGNWCGPELGFGHVVGNHIDNPVVIIKTSWGGKDLAVDFRPPGAGEIPYEFGGNRQKRLEEEPELVGHFYRLMFEHAREVCGNLGKYFPGLAGRKVEFAGFGWHQGWNDGCNVKMTEEYEKNMARFIRDVRKELGKPKLPFVIGGSGFGGDNIRGRRKDLLEAQLAMADADKHPEFKGNVAAVDTRPFWRPAIKSPSKFGYHWNHNGETHYLMGEAMGEAIVELLEK